MGLIVVDPGVASTVQEEGRSGLREFGVPTGGAFDRASARLANALAGNGRGAAVVELTMVGGVFEARGSHVLALAGAPMRARVFRDGEVLDVSIPSAFAVLPGDRLAIGGGPRGLRAYLAIRGGWRSASVRGSRSSEVRLRVGDGLDADPVLNSPSFSRRRPRDASYPDPFDGPIRLIDGPEGPVPGRMIDLEARYRVGGSSDRVGIRLEGPSLAGFDRPERVSAPVAPGAVQVAGGRPIVIGVAGGTLGGYPHVAHVIDADLDRIGQARPGDVLRFARVELEEARRLGRERRRLLASRDLRVALGAGWRGLD